MQRNARSVATTVATLTPLLALAGGEAAQQYDNSNKVVYAKQQLLKWRRDSDSEQNGETSKMRETGAAAWLGSAPPKFPYLLSISPGDNPAIVANKLVEGAKVLGSYEEPTRDTLEKVTEPTSALGLIIHKIATSYAALKTAVHGNVPDDFDPRVGLKVNEEEMMMDALLDALRDLQYNEQQHVNSGEIDEASGSTSLLISKPPAVPVFLVRDFDTLSDKNAERWLRWTHQVSSEGLAYVVLLTTSTVTPSKVQWILTRHQNALSDTASNDVQEFVGILLRPANGVVDSSSADDKLHEISALHNLKLFSEATEECSIDHVGDTTSRENSCAAEIEAILKVTGNWWSDINEICRRLIERNLNTVTTNEERFTVIQEVCTAFTQDMENKLLKFLYLDGSLQIPSDSGSLTTREVDSAFDTSKIFSALETWKCLETLAGVTPVTSGSALVGSPQQLLEKKDKTPLNCVSLVEALLPFNYRKEGEEKFLDLIDQNVLFLRPKDAVEIGVIPCKNTSLLSPCWAQTRPVVKRAFEKIHRSDTYFRIILNLDRIAANVEMRNEIEQYEHEIEERRQVLSDMKRDFTILQFSMTPAEKATRKAELALIDVELQAKDVYLEKLRSLLTP